LDTLQFFRLFLAFTLSQVFSLVNPCLFAQSNEDVQRSLEQDWMIYDWEANVYLPFIPEIHNEYKSLTLVLDKQNYEAEHVQLRYHEPLDVFINSKLFYSLEAQKALNIPIEKLNIGGGDSLISLSVHTVKAFNKAPNVFITKENFVERKSYSFNEIEIERARERSFFEKWPLLVIVFSIIAFSVSNRSSFNPILSFTSIDGISAFFSDNKRGMGTKLNASILIFYFLLISAILAISILLLNIEPSVFGFEIFPFQSFPGVLSSVSRFFNLFLLIGSLVFLKIFIIWSVGGLFNLKSETYIHLYEFMAFSQLFYLVLFFLVIALGFYPYLIDNQILVMLFRYGFSIVAIMVTLKIYRVISFKNVFIISYFCITEFVPALIMIRVF